MAKISWNKVILILLIFPFLFLVITVPMAYTYSEKVDYNIKSNHTYPTIDGYYYYPSINYSEVYEDRDFDEKGVVVANYGGSLGVQYNPVTLSQYVLVIAPYASTNSDAYESMIVNLDFLLSNAKTTARGNLIYPYNFDWPINNESAPWYSSMAQGEAASALLWGYRVSNDTKYLEGAKKSIFALVEENSTVPFIKQKNGGIWFKEYPHYQYEVLDGSLATNGGIYDLYKSLNESDPDRYLLEQILSDSISCFKNSSHEFDSVLFGHYYDNKGTIPNPNYYSCNLAWLEYLSTYDPELETIRNGYMMEECDTTTKLLMWYWNKVNNVYYRIMP
jgi:hypothetical protein